MVELSICIGSSCHLKGSYNIIQIIQQQIEEKSLHDKIDFKAAFCMKECNNNGVCVSLNGKKHTVTQETAKEFFENVIELVEL